jgi:predicted AAA+ superfamily ATPase
MFKRILTPHLRKDPRNVLLIGPRQVGKSTLLGSLNPDLTLNLASPTTYRDYLAHPEQFEAELAAADPSVRVVFLDEVQRVPALLDAVQVQVDKDPRRFRFLLSGSSARKLRRGQANLLPGRIHLHHLHPLLACELGDAFDLNRVLAHGTLPGIYSESDPEARAADLRAYTDVYLREEVQAEALVRNLGGYTRLLDLVAASSGKALNLAALSQDAGIAHETVRRYLEVLEDTLLVFRVPAWSGSKRAGLVTHPKHFLFDLGVRNALLRRPLDRPLPDEIGLLFEHLVAYELVRRQGSLWPEVQVYYYRTKHGAEIDFVLEVGRELWAIEVKASRRAPGSVAAFDSLAKRTTRLSRKIVVFLGPRPQRMGDVEILPLQNFLELLPA